jgi:UDP-glucose 4-epimerase
MQNKQINIIANHRWVIIGAGGFIGSNLCRRLVQEGADVIAFGRNINFPEALNGCKWVKGSYLDQTALATALDGADVVVHTLSTVTPAKSNQSPMADIEENLLGTLKLMDLCRAKDVNRLIFLSSGGTVYGSKVPIPTPEDAANDPICSYGVVKLAIEKYLAIQRDQGTLDSVVLRIANPFGPYQLAHGQGVIAAIIERILNNQPAEIWGDGSVTRDYIFIEDVVDAIIAAAQLNDPQAPRLFNIGSGVGRSLQEVIDSIAKIHGHMDINRLPGRAVDVPVSILDIQRAERFLGWYPHTEWMDGLRATYGWLQQIHR